MKIALFSDIHANLSALQAVLADIEGRNPDLIYCLGDLVGYAPYPSMKNPDSVKVGFVRVAYDFETMAQAIEASPLPNDFADMLRKAY
jgi:predicted phosphodiesterase